MHVPYNQERIKGCLLYLGGSSYFTFSLRSNVQHSVCVLQDVRRSLCLCWRWRPPLSGLEQKEVCPPKCPWQPWNEPLLLASRRPRKGKGNVVAAWCGDPYRLVGRTQDATCTHTHKLHAYHPYPNLKHGCVYCYECWDDEKTAWAHLRDIQQC